MARAGTDRTRAAAILWGGWLLVTGAVFSFMSGTIHPYYAVALAPAIAALVAIGARVLWSARSRPGRLALSAMAIASAVWAYVLLGRTDWLSALRWVVLVGGVVAGLVLVVRLRRLAVVAALAAVLSAGAGTAAYAAATASVAHMAGAGGSTTASAQVAAWVEAHYTAQTVGSTTVYDLSQPAAS